MHTEVEDSRKQKKRGYIYGVLLAIMVIILLEGGALTELSPRIIIVCPSGCAFASIQSAINSAIDGDIIIIEPGTYYENVVVNKSLNVTGIGMPVIEGWIPLEVTSNNSIIQGLTLTGGNIGIRIISDNNIIRNNNVTLNYGNGIDLEKSNNNEIFNNSCSKNGGEYGYGIYIFNSSRNIIYFNELDNYRNAFDDSTNNTWYNFTLQRGNKYSDYIGLDNDSNGVGDTPYIIGGPGGAQDIFPLMGPPSERAPSIAGVYEFNLKVTSIMIGWRTDQPTSNNRVLYSTSEDLYGGIWSAWSNATTSPIITLSNLLPNTKYFYICYAYNGMNSSLFSNSTTLNFTTPRNLATWTVDDNNLDVPNPPANFTKIQDAINLSIDGDTILVYYGTYQENIIVDKSLNLTGIEKPGTGKPHIKGNHNVGSEEQNGDVISLGSSRNIVQGFEISGTSMGALWATPAGIRIGYTTWFYAGGAWYHKDKSSNNNEIRDNIIHDSAYGVYTVSLSNYNDITHNTFVANGITIHFARYNNITHNDFGDAMYSSYIHIEGIDVPYNSDYPLYNKIENNNFMRSYKHNFPQILIGSYITNNTISGNTLSGYGGISVYSNKTHIINNTIIGIEDTPSYDDNGIQIGHSHDCLIFNNTIEYKNRGVYIDSSSTHTSSSGIIMRNNHLSNNRYNFYIDPGPPEFAYMVGHVPNFDDFNQDIDSSNTVNGEFIYYMKNVSSVIYDQNTLPHASFLACLNCNNITIRNLTLSYNSHGLLFYNSSDSVVENINTYGNALGGISLYNSTNVTIRNSSSFNNGDDDSFDNSYSKAVGILLGKTTNSKIENAMVESNWLMGILLDVSNNNIISNSSIQKNGGGTQYRPIYYGGGIGLDHSSHRNLIYSNNIAGSGERNYGLIILDEDSENNTIYNNIFNNTINAYDNYAYNQWNISKTQGINIVGGPYLGGNYWQDYAGKDLSGEDEIGDTEIPYNSSGKIKRGGDYLPLIKLEEKNEKVEFEIIILSPEKKLNINRSVILKYNSPVPLKNASYILDGGKPVIIDPQESILINRLSLGEHSLVLKGWDYNGNFGRGEVLFRIIPLALGELYTSGTPEFPDEIAFSFISRPVDYKLTFEVKGEVAEVEIYLNKYIKGVMGESSTLTDYVTNGSHIGSLELSNNWVDYQFDISSENFIASDVENIISFIHVNNSQKSDNLTSWEIRNVTLLPILPSVPFPSISVFSDTKAISIGGDLNVYTRIDGAAEENEFDAYIYIIGPDGKIRYYPNWDEKPSPIDTYYLRNSYYGKLPGRLEFNDSFIPGTYNIVGKITQNGSDRSVSLSTEKIYYNNRTSVKLYVNREVVVDGGELVIENAITRGHEKENGTLIISLESPLGDTLYLPMLTNMIDTTSYQPIQSMFSTVYEGVVDSGWQNGTYVVRSSLYSDEGDILVQDLQVFEVCREKTELIGNFLRNATDNDTSPIILSRIRLIDLYSGEVIENENKTSNQSSYFINPPPGKYFLTGEFVSENGSLYTIPLIRINLKCGIALRRNIILEYGGQINKEIIGVTNDSGITNRFLSALFNGQSDQFALQKETTGDCSKPKLLTRVTVDDDALDLLKRLPPYYDGSPAAREKWERYFGKILLENLRKKFPGIELYSYEETMNVLQELEQIEIMNPETRNKIIMNIRPVMGTEYFYVANVHRYDINNFLIFSWLVDRDTGKNIEVYETTAEDPTEALEFLVGYEDIIKKINDHEKERPLPPRDPKISVSLLPEEGVSPEPGKNKAVILAEITNCKGEPAEPSQYSPKPLNVFFQKTMKRGTVEADATGIFIPGPNLQIASKDHVIGFALAGGLAHAHYTLTEGLGSGEEKVEIITFGRGLKKATAAATIKINGVGIEVKPEKNVLVPTQSTLIHLQLYLEKDGKKTPLEGKSIIIDKNYIKDSKIIPMGQTDNRGNPVTNFEGRATLKFVAGNKEGLVKIPVRYEAEDFKDSIKTTAFVRIREDEYLIHIKWNENYEFCTEWSFSGSWSYSRDTSPYVCGCNRETICSDSGSSLQSSSGNLKNGFIFISNIIWERGSGKETTSGRLAYHSQGQYFSSFSRSWSTTTGSGSDSYWYSTTITTGINSEINDVETYMVFEDRNGNLLIQILPLEIPMPLKIQKMDIYSRSESYNCIVCENTYSKSDSGSYSHTYSYDGGIYYPDPSFFPFTYRSYFGPGFHEPFIELEKTGKNSWKSFEYSWSGQLNSDEIMFDIWYYLFNYYRENPTWIVNRDFEITVSGLKG